MSSFEGATVKLTLRSGEFYIGRILRVDSTTATLHVERADTHQVTCVRREELQDVSTVATPAANATPTANAPPAASATLVSNVQPAVNSIPRAEPPDSPSQTGAAKNKKRGGRKSKGSGTATPVSAPANLTMKEFDYTKSTQSFDKKKTWEEIRQSQSGTSTDQLLVMLNRRPASTETNQPMLAPTEMVLSAEERTSPATPTSTATSKATAMHDATQKELVHLREEHARLMLAVETHKQRAALAEVLTGLQVDSHTEPDVYTCTIYSDARLAVTEWRAQQTQEAPSVPAQNALQYAIRMPTSESLQNGGPAMLTYLGPIASSDPALLAKLPDHFRHEISVKLENAALFQQRLDALVRHA
ncbi:hypothetical protein MVES1_003976 [Malassezia vespertilionis]|uniref:uncharacterized protein n=1 Tax=Malassezia vespertilionis TaxID=2020962 RepID=UPI0024B0FDE7|nr:uncharacterized protein MVES1_003976 [Malassezia vespertilionis]WFD08600.1 hypothetical protein MVES1_003976 [Malassezia vespertilionis]